MGQLTILYFEHAKVHYQKDSRPTSKLHIIQSANPGAEPGTSPSARRPVGPAEMAKGETSSVQTPVRWSGNGAFLLRSFSMPTEEGVVQESTQVIGWDPRAKHIRSWTFDGDGSFGESLWSKSESDWLIKSSQILADGRAASIILLSSSRMPPVEAPLDHYELARVRS